MSPITRSLEDDGINGSVIGKTTSDVSNEQIINSNKPKLNLQSRIIEYIIEHKNEKPTRGDVFVHVSGSGTSGVIITSLIKAGVFREEFFECKTCTYLIPDETKVNI